MSNLREQIAQLNILFLVWLSAQDDQFASEMGIEPAQLRELRSTSFRNIDASRELIVSLNHDKLKTLLRRQDGYLRNMALAERAMQLGARLNIIRDYTGMSSNEYQLMLKALGLKTLPRGRILLLEEGELELVLEAWNEIVDAGPYENGLEPFCLLAERTRIPLDRIYASVGRQLKKRQKSLLLHRNGHC